MGNPTLSSTGNPTLATNWAFSDTPSASTAITGTRTTYKFEGITVGSSMNNLALAIWTPDEEASTNLFNIANVKLEKSAIVTPFEARHFRDEKRLYDRLFEQIDIGGFGSLCMGQAVTTSQVDGIFSYTRKRTTPTITASGVGHFDATNAGGGLAGPATGVSFGNIGYSAAAITLTGLTGLVAGNAANVYMNTSSAQINVDARL